MKKHIAPIAILLVLALALSTARTAIAATPWLHTSGNWILDPNNNQVTLRGCSVVCPEYQTGTKNTNQIIDLIANSATGWFTRVVRLPVCTSGNAATDYALIDPIVQHCIAKGLYVIVDLHFVQDYGSAAGQVPQSQVLNFWNTIAPHYASSPNVIFEVYNEPVNPADWNTWKSYIQPVVNAIRAVAPNNLILMGSPQWSTFVNQAVSNQITGGNIVYVYHLYPNQGAPTTSFLDGKYGTAANSVPVVLGEFGWQNPGDSVTTGTTSGFGTPLKTYMEAHKNINWVAWVANNTETNWLPIMFDASWNLLGGDSYEGQFVHDWLNADQNDHQPSNPSAPPVPTGLTATAGNAQVALSWNASSGATAYDVKRSTVSGTGYATISSPTGTSYTNTGLTNGTTYYYVVAAKNANGSSANSGQVSGTPSAGATQAQIPFATTAPTIDGTVDSVWSTATAYALSKTTGTISSGTDLTATWKALWTSTNLYVLFDVTADDVKKNDSTAVYDDDSVELYLDADRNGGTVYDANDRQIQCGWGDATPLEGGGRGISGVSFAKADPTGTSYRVELKIPWSIEAFTPTNNAIIGVDAMVNDDDDGAGVDGKRIWNDGTNSAWNNPSLFGSGKLLAAPAGNTHGGTWAAKGVFTATPSWHNLWAYGNSVTPNTSYVASFWLKGSGSVVFRVYNGNWVSEIFSQTYAATSTWTQKSFTFNTGSNTQLTYALFDGGSVAGTLYVDDCFLGVSGGTNLLANSGFESGAASWNISAPAEWSILQNP
jgi:fibronectin type 3 domain-containing protein